MGQSNTERQRRFRERQKQEHGRTAFTFLLTADEAFYVERIVREMRTTGGTPAMMRNKKGHLYALDA